MSKAEIQKLELLQKRTEIHPDVRILNEQIAKINLNSQNIIKVQLTAYNIISNSLKQKQENLNVLIAKYSGKLEKLPEQENRLASLIRQKEALEKMYNLMLEKREEMRVAELSKLQDIIILDKAIESNKTNCSK